MKKAIANAPVWTTVVGVVIAGAVSITALVTSLTGTATADPRGDETGTDLTLPTVDLDSLYAAKASEETSGDTTSIEMIAPESSTTGHVSWYGPGFHGRRTANGEKFDKNGISAAHKKLPFGTLVRVVDDRTGRAILVRVNDRGPFVRGRVLDLSEEAAALLGMKGRGSTNATLEVFTPAEVSGATHASLGASGSFRYLTFDSDVKGVRPNGWSVSVAELSGFSEAVKLHNELRSEFSEVYLTQFQRNGTTTYRISIGLFSDERLSRNMIVEVSDRFESATVIRFVNGLPTDAPLQASVADADTARGEG